MRIVTRGVGLVLAVGVALVGCSTGVDGVAPPDRAAVPTAAPSPTPPPAPTGDVFADTRGRFGIAPPAGWSVDSGGARGTAVEFVDAGSAGPDAKRFSANITVLVVPSPADLADTVAGSRQELRGVDGYTSHHGRGGRAA